MDLHLSWYPTHLHVSVMAYAQATRHRVVHLLANCYAIGLNSCFNLHYTATFPPSAVCPAAPFIAPPWLIAVPLLVALLLIGLSLIVLAKLVLIAMVCKASTS